MKPLAVQAGARPAWPCLALLLALLPATHSAIASHTASGRRRREFLPDLRRNCKKENKERKRQNESDGGSNRCTEEERRERGGGEKGREEGREEGEGGHRRL